MSPPNKKITIIGLDEAGRGPWAGPICAAAVAISPHESAPLDTRDSKKIPEAMRELIASKIKGTLRYAIATISAQEIDRGGVHQANRLAFELALETLLQTHPELTSSAHQIVIDGNPYKGIQIPTAEFFQKGEDKFPAIAAASILAKTHRDKILRDIHQQHPQYGFANHKGYGSKGHQEALQIHGIIPGIHRMSFKPIAKIRLRQDDLFFTGTEK